MDILFVSEWLCHCGGIQLLTFEASNKPDAVGLYGDETALVEVADGAFVNFLADLEAVFNEFGRAFVA